MAINTGLAQLSEGLVTAATGAYMLAVVGYTGEYAFGRRGRVARTSAPAQESILVGAGTPVLPVLPPQIPQYGAGVVEVKRDAGDKWGLAAVGLTVLAAVLHAAAVIIRGISVDRVPWGNMYEFTLVVGLIAVVAWLATLVKMPALRYLGLFVMLPVLLVMFLAGTLYTKASK